MKILEILDKELMLKKLESELRSTGRLSSHDVNNEDGVLSVRYWGDWEVPEDEEDDGDYDWKVLTPASSKKLDSIIKKFEIDNKCKVEVQGSEKCWLDFSIKT